MRIAFIVFAGALVVYGLTSLPSPYNEQQRQAVAFLHGHTYIDSPEIDGDHSFFEHAAFGGHSYALHPPLAAVAMMPFVWAGQRVASVLFGALAVALVWVLLAKLGMLVDEQIWLTAFFGLGTIFWTETIQGSTWTLPNVVTMCVELLLLIELTGKARPLRTGIYAGLSALGLYQLAFVFPVYAWLVAGKCGGIYNQIEKRQPAWDFTTNVLWMLPGILGGAVIYIAYNEVRYRALTDRGLWLIPHVNPGQLFALKYLPGNLNTLFVMGPRIDDTFPYVHPVFVGQALTFTSIAFIMALRAPLKRAWPMWLAAALAAGPMLLYFANGFSQFGARHYVDCYPFLLVLMAMEKVDQITKILICVSVCFISIGVLTLHLWGLS